MAGLGRGMGLALLVLAPLLAACTRPRLPVPARWSAFQGGGQPAVVAAPALKLRGGGARKKKLDWQTPKGRGYGYDSESSEWLPGDDDELQAPRQRGRPPRHRQVSEEESEESESLLQGDDSDEDVVFARHRGRNRPVARAPPRQQAPPVAVHPARGGGGGRAGRPKRKAAVEAQKAWGTQADDDLERALAGLMSSDEEIEYESAPVPQHRVARAPAPAPPRRQAQKDPRVGRPPAQRGVPPLGRGDRQVGRKEPTGLGMFGGRGHGPAAMEEADMGWAGFPGIEQGGGSDAFQSGGSSDEVQGVRGMPWAGAEGWERQTQEAPQKAQDHRAFWQALGSGSARFVPLPPPTAQPPAPAPEHRGLSPPAALSRASASPPPAGKAPPMQEAPPHPLRIPHVSEASSAHDRGSHGRGSTAISEDDDSASLDSSPVDVGAVERKLNETVARALGKAGALVLNKQVYVASGTGGEGEPSGLRTGEIERAVREALQQAHTALQEARELPSMGGAGSGDVEELERGVRALDSRAGVLSQLLASGARRAELLAAPAFPREPNGLLRRDASCVDALRRDALAAKRSLLLGGSWEGVAESGGSVPRAQEQATRCVYVGGYAGLGDRGVRDMLERVCGKMEAFEWHEGWSFARWPKEQAAQLALGRQWTDGARGSSLVVLPAPEGRIVRGGLLLEMGHQSPLRPQWGRRDCEAAR